MASDSNLITAGNDMVIVVHCVNIAKTLLLHQSGQKIPHLTDNCNGLTISGTV